MVNREYDAAAGVRRGRQCAARVHGGGTIVTEASGCWVEAWKALLQFPFLSVGRFTGFKRRVGTSQRCRCDVGTPPRVRAVERIFRSCIEARGAMVVT